MRWSWLGDAKGLIGHIEAATVTIAQNSPGYLLPHLIYFREVKEVICVKSS